MNDQYAALAELAGGFIHEIKNHLSTLGLNLELLVEDLANPESQRERRALARAQKIQGECGRLVDVANDFLRFARIKELELRPTELAKILDEMLDFFSPTARSARIEIKPYISADLPPVMLDREMFKQALLNLLLNAEQSMPQGGTIVVLAIPEKTDAGKPCVSLSLIDSGQGMSAETLTKVFQPFFSTKSSGSGLGLPTTRKIVEAHGGTIEAESAAGCGTKFTIRLPVR